MNLNKLTVILFCGLNFFGHIQFANAEEKVVTILRVAEAERYDPHRVVSRASNEMMFMMADTLLALDFDMRTVKPLLAESWDVSDDGLLYTFTLRDDVRFCDGRKFVANDVVASFKRWMDPSSPKAAFGGDVDSITAPDDRTVLYKLKKPYSALLLQLTQTPSSIIDISSVEKLGPDFGVKGFNGTGPFCWESWLPRNQMVLKKNSHYKWGPEFYKNRGPALVDKLVFKQLPEEGTRLAAMISKQADLTQFIPRWAIPKIKSVPTIKISEASPYFSVLFMGFKTDRPLVSDVQVRQAISLAIDREALARSIFFEQVTPAYTYSASDAEGFNPALMDIAPKFDLVKAKALLDEAGWVIGPDGFRYKDGTKLAPVMVIPAAILAEAGQAVQGALRQIGVDVKSEVLDSALFFGRLREQSYDIYALQQPYLTADTLMQENFVTEAIPSPNRMNWRNKEFDRLIDEAAMATSDQDRQSASFAAQMIAHNDFVWMPLAHDRAFLIVGPRLKPVRAHGNQGVAIYKGLDLELAK